MLASILGQQGRFILTALLTRELESVLPTCTDEGLLSWSINVDIKSEASSTIQDVYIEVEDRMVDEE